MGRTRALTGRGLPGWIAALACGVSLFACLIALMPFDGAMGALASAVTDEPRGDGRTALAGATWRTVLCLMAGGAVIARLEGDVVDSKRRWPSVAVLATCFAGAGAAALVLERGRVWPDPAGWPRLLGAALLAGIAAVVVLRSTRGKPRTTVVLVATIAGALWLVLGAHAAGPSEAQAARSRYLFGGAWAPTPSQTVLALGGWVTIHLPRITRWATPAGLGLVLASVGPLPLVGALALIPGGASRGFARGLWGAATALASCAVLALARPGTALPAGVLTALIGVLYLAARAVRARLAARPG